MKKNYSNFIKYIDIFNVHSKKGTTFIIIKFIWKNHWNNDIFECHQCPTVDSGNHLISIISFNPHYNTIKNLYFIFIFKKNIFLLKLYTLLRLKENQVIHNSAKRKAKYLQRFHKKKNVISGC